MTMLELLITLGVIGILSVAAAPSLSDMLGGVRFDIHFGQLVRDLNLSRGEAVKRGSRVVMGVTDTLWSQGWRVFEDKDSDDVYDADGDEELLVRTSLSGVTLVGGDDFATFIRYTGSGKSNTSGKFILEAVDGSDKEIVCIGGTGRLKISQCPAAADPCELVDPCP